VARASSIIISGTADQEVEPLWKKIAAGADHARAIRTLAWVGILVLFLWLTLNVDLIIFAGVLRRAADRMSGFTRIPVGVALPLVVLPVLAFLAGIGWFFAQAIANQIDQLTQQLPAAAAKVGTIVRQSIQPRQDIHGAYQFNKHYGISDHNVAKILRCGFNCC
jgi:predicted PurR-regulated permease PerM